MVNKKQTNPRLVMSNLHTVINTSKPYRLSEWWVGLSRRQKERVLSTARMRMGLSTRFRDPEYSDVMIAKETGLTRERVRQLRHLLASSSDQFAYRRKKEIEIIKNAIKGGGDLSAFPRDRVRLAKRELGLFRQRPTEDDFAERRRILRTFELQGPKNDKPSVSAEQLIERYKHLYDKYGIVASSFFLLSRDKERVDINAKILSDGGIDFTNPGLHSLLVRNPERLKERVRIVNSIGLEEEYHWLLNFNIDSLEQIHKNPGYGKIIEGIRQRDTLAVVNYVKGIIYNLAVRKKQPRPSFEMVDRVVSEVYDLYKSCRTPENNPEGFLACLVVLAKTKHKVEIASKIVEKPETKRYDSVVYGV